MSADDKVRVEGIKRQKTNMRFMHHKEAAEEEVVDDQTSPKSMHID
jgi:hypothetical protein